MLITFDKLKENIFIFGSKRDYLFERKCGVIINDISLPPKTLALFGILLCFIFWQT